MSPEMARVLAPLVPMRLAKFPVPELMPMLPVQVEVVPPTAFRAPWPSPPSPARLRLSPVMVTPCSSRRVPPATVTPLAVVPSEVLLVARSTPPVTLTTPVKELSPPRTTVPVLVLEMATAPALSLRFPERVRTPPVELNTWVPAVSAMLSAMLWALALLLTTFPDSVIALPLMLKAPAALRNSMRVAVKLRRSFCGARLVTPVKCSSRGGTGTAPPQLSGLDQSGSVPPPFHTDWAKAKEVEKSTSPAVRTADRSITEK